MTSLFVCCLGRLYRCCAALVSQVCHVWALKKGMGPPAVFRALPCGLSPPLEALEGTGNRSSCKGPQKELSGHLRKVTTPACCCLKWQTGVVLLFAKQTLIPDLLLSQTEHSVVWLPTSSRAQSTVGSLCTVFFLQLLGQGVWGPQPQA